MKKKEWIKTGKGLEYRNHDSRKVGVKFDRYFRARFMVNGKQKVISFGWESQYLAAEKSRQRQEGGNGVVSFLDYINGEIARFKTNAVKGEGPATLKEDRELTEAKKRAELEAQRVEELLSISFGQYFDDEYSVSAKVNKKGNTWKAEQSYFKVWLNPYLGKLRLIDIRPLHIEKLKRDMLKKGKTPRTIQAVMALGRQVWNHARNNDVVIGEWPGRSVKPGKFDNRRIRFLTYEETDLLLEELKTTSKQVYDMALLSLHTGMRAGEVFSLTWENINMDAGQIRVVDPKNTKSRTAYLTEGVRTMLEALPDRQGLVFPSRTGERISQISATVIRAIEKIGLNDGIDDRRNKATFHSLRHTFASRLVEAGTPLMVVKELMGHSTLAMTERYSHVRNESLQSAVKQMEKAMKERKERAKKVVSINRNS